MICPVILCDGSGTRLWPLSRKGFPKQFIPLLGEKSLLQLTLEGVAPLLDDRVDGRRPVVALDTKDPLIIDTPDALLVAHASQAEVVKDVVSSRLEALDLPQAVQHRRVARPWGWYDSIDRDERFQVKRIAVKPGASLSLQKHHHRAEHWIVVTGTARVTKGSETFLLTENQSTHIPIGETHRLENPGETELEMIEVQSGSYLGEDDIVRLTDNYGRA